MKQVTITLYSLNELKPASKERAIIEHAAFLMEYEQQKYEREDVITSIEANEYLYYYTGDIASIIQYGIEGETAVYLNLRTAQFKLSHK